MISEYLVSSRFPGPCSYPLVYIFSLLLHTTVFPKLDFNVIEDMFLKIEVSERHTLVLKVSFALY